MSIVIFSGTSEGRIISEYLSKNEIYHDVFVATKSGEIVMEKNMYANVMVGRLDEDKIENYLSKNDTELLIDATHPYADIITKNLKRACDNLNIKYIRVSRENGEEFGPDIVAKYYDSSEKCAEKLCKSEGNIFLTTGSKELKKYMIYPDLKDRLFVRVLPSLEAIDLCIKAGINEKQIIAMYGPHTKEINSAIINQYNIKHLVTKESGQVGGFSEKVEACRSNGTNLHIIERPDSEKGISVTECISLINELKGLNGRTIPKLNISLVGIGPGNTNDMTQKASKLLDEADYVFGAKRMLESYDGSAVKIPEYMPERIIDKLEEISRCNYESEINIVALFSGDTGLYSGATKLYNCLVKWGKCDSVKIVPGISSFSLMAAAICTNYEDTHLESLHGKTDDIDNQNRIKRLISDKEKVFLLMSGKADFSVLRNLIDDSFDGDIIVGYNLSYPSQKIINTDIQNMQNDISCLDEGLFIVVINSGKNK